MQQKGIEHLEVGRRAEEERQEGTTNIMSTFKEDSEWRQLKQVLIWSEY